MLSFDILKKTFGEFKALKEERWNADYEGILIKTVDSNQFIRSRLAKKTSKKAGYFTVFWMKNKQYQNVPYTDVTSPELLAIVIHDENRKGIFLIPKDIAIKKNILTSQHTKGKMAMRFYPTWCSQLNKTALATQKWQVKYFTDLSE